MKITQITFISKDPKCSVTQPRRYHIGTNDSVMALEAAEGLLNDEEQSDRYRALPAVIITVHGV